MADELSIIKSNEIDLEENKSDVGARLAKGILGIVPIPYLGALVSEAVSTLIPNQKLERLTIFVKVLGDKVKYIEESVLKEKLNSEEGADLLEDGLVQASRALSDERKHYIASLIKNSLTIDDLSHVEKKYLLWLLNQLNDVEIIHLKYYSLRLVQERNDFMDTHKHLLRRRPLIMGAKQEEIDREALLDGYRNHLLQLELIKGDYQIPARDKAIEFDKHTGKLKVTHYGSTGLGNLLLRYIDLLEDEPNSARAK